LINDDVNWPRERSRWRQSRRRWRRRRMLPVCWRLSTVTPLLLAATASLLTHAFIHSMLLARYR